MIKNKLIIIIIICSVSISLLYYFLFQNVLKGDLIQKKINFEISTNHNVYLRGESIWIKARLVNNSEQTYYLKGSFTTGAGIQLIIKNSNGVIIRNPIQSAIMEGIDSIEFQPGDTLESWQTLDWYEFNITDLPAHFTIGANYKEFTSNEIKFSIQEPEGDEKIMFDFLNKYNSERIFKRHDGKYLDIKAMELLNQYPNSHYVPAIYEQLLSMLFAYDSDSNEFDKYFDKYMREYSNNANIGSIIHIYSASLKMKNRDGVFVKEKLNELKDSYSKNSNLENEINVYIKRNIDYDNFWFKK